MAREDAADRRLLAILAADIVGYSRLMEMDEAGTISRLRSARLEIVDPCVARHGGRIVKLMGDGTLAVFDSVVEAVACAAQIQQSIAERNVKLTEPQRILMRIGVNLGDVVLLDDDVYGDGVNVAARLEQLSEPGGVAISGTAHDHLQGKLDLPFDFMGEQRVKNIERLLKVYRWRPGGRPASGNLPRIVRRWSMPAAGLLALAILAAGSWQFWPATDPTGDRPAIAVLPFDNLGGDEATGRIADGLTEDVITDLSAIPEFRVLSRNATEGYKGKAVDIRQIGQELNVRFVFEGSIQRDGDRIRATAQLIDAQSGAHLWSHRWERPAGDLFAIQSEIAEQIAARMQDVTGPIHGVAISSTRRKQPESLSVYELYLLGREKLVRGGPDDVAQAVRILTEAVAQDPNFVRAWVELANAHVVSSNYAADPGAAKRAGQSAAERAVELDPSEPEAHVSLGQALAMQGNLARAEVEFDTALRLAPRDFEILTFYAGWGSAFGKPERGAEAADQAIQQNPNYEIWAAGMFGYAYFMAGRFDDAVKMLAQKRPETLFPGEWLQFAGALAHLGRDAEARSAVEAAGRHFPSLSIERDVLNDPIYNDTERQRLLEAAKLAGFPVCAAGEALSIFAMPERLPECENQPGGEN